MRTDILVIDDNAFIRSLLFKILAHTAMLRRTVDESSTPLLEYIFVAIIGIPQSHPSVINAPLPPEVPDVPDIPDVPDEPEIPLVPSVPEIPDAPDLA